MSAPEPRPSIFQRMPLPVALVLGFTLLPIGIIIFPIAPEFGIPLLLISTRLLGRRFAWARRFNAWVDARWMSLRARLRGGSPGDGPSRWRWIFGTLFIIVCWQVIGTIFALVAAAGTGLTLDEFLPAEGYGATPLAPDRAALVIFAVMVSFIPFIAANLIAYRYILKLKLTRLFTQIGRFSGRRLMFGFAVWLALGLVGTLVFEIANPGVVEWSFNPAGALPYVAVALLLIPIQTTAEELLFRGWFLQWSDNGRRRRTTLAVFNGVIFALPHLANPEVAGEDLIRIVGYVGRCGLGMGDTARSHPGTRHRRACGEQSLCSSPRWLRWVCDPIGLALDDGSYSSDTGDSAGCDWCCRVCVDHRADRQDGAQYPNVELHM